MSIPDFSRVRKNPLLHVFDGDAEKKFPIFSLHHHQKHVVIPWGGELFDKLFKSSDDSYGKLMVYLDLHYPCCCAASSKYLRAPFSFLARAILTISCSNMSGCLIM